MNDLVGLLVFYSNSQPSDSFQEGIKILMDAYFTGSDDVLFPLFL